MPELVMSAMVLAAEINRVASAAGGLPRELAGLWDPLREICPFSAAWLGVLDTGGRRFLTAAAVGHDPAARADLESGAYYAAVEASGMLRRGRPMCLRNRGRPSDCPSCDGLWGTAGPQEGLGVPLIAADGRPVGLLVLSTDATGHPTEDGCQVIGEVAPMIAAAIDPMTSLLGLAGLVVDAGASVAVGSDGAVHPLPGSSLHPLLAPGSPVVSIAADSLRIHGSPTGFLCPYPGQHSDVYVRVTVIACPLVPPSPFGVLVIVSPPGDLHGLTPRELEVLGLVIDGSTNRQIASTMFITQRTVAAHLEHIRAKLGVPTRTAAAVRSLNHSLFVPSQLAGPGDLFR
ncbi:LuxR C-terminal-related transcriptional regulator [Actinoplanes sp. NPDC048791]|uniref:LuxR C-terminal-related transcriptional regulator n=1 Tax=Actinoplanes sp. NPDC048791 TaxID=3154623 RepID=UPI0033CB9124